ncbi:MAG: hypothetical protein NVS1B12_12880 [Acidimicrobiales bacterium]
MPATPSPDWADDDRDLATAASALGAVIRSQEEDGTGWRWRCGWKGVEMGAWNDMDGVAVVADIGPWDEWVGLRGHPADPSSAQALSWAVGVIEPWLADPENAERIASRIIARAERRS